jgi:hypothetical protein
MAFKTNFEECGEIPENAKLITTSFRHTKKDDLEILKRINTNSEIKVKIFNEFVEGYSFDFPEKTKEFPPQ